MALLWFKAFHLIFMVTWMAGIFYLPRLFVYHAMCEESDHVGKERFKVMERKLFFGIMTPGAILTLICGWAMIYIYGLAYLKTQIWLHAKLTILALMVGYHIHCFFILRRFKEDRNQKSHVYYRFYNEVPVLFLIAVVLLAVLKPWVAT